MKQIKSHITFTKQQRYGIFSLILVIISIQLVYAFLSFETLNAKDSTNAKAIQQAIVELDSLKSLTIDNPKEYKIYPFNPNYITDYKGYRLGMKTEEIDRLLAYRKLNKWINSAKEFQSITKVSDSLLQVISPYFKFPDWVYSKSAQQNNFSATKVKNPIFDLNSASPEQLKSIYGIGEFYANKIIEERKRLNGFAAYQELSTIYGLSPEVLGNIKSSTVINNPRVINTINLNTATKADLVKIPFIDYEIAYKIIKYRTLNEKINDIDELLKINVFTSSKFEIIKLYLHIN
jgi:competence protein ComEA